MNTSNNIFRDIKVTVAPQFRMNGNPYCDFPFGKMFPIPKDISKPTYCDYNGHSKETVDKIIKIVSLQDVIYGMKNNPILKRRCEALRTPGVDELNQKHIKMIGLNRIYLGEFDLNETNEYKFKNDNIVNYPGVVCFDVDKLTVLELDMVRDIIKTDPYTLVSFLSPRGNGYKWMVRVPALKENHELYYNSLIEYYNSIFLGTIKFDMSCRNIGRCQFASYDSELYTNSNSLVWIKKQIKIEIIPTNNEKKYVQKSVSKLFETAVYRIENGIRGSKEGTLTQDNAKAISFVDGQKHFFIVALAAACRGMDISESDFMIEASMYLKDDDAKKTVSKIYKYKNK